MAISVDALRQYAGNGTMVLSADNRSVEKAGARHAISDLFGTKAAREVNRNTLDAVKTAVLTDERYFGIREKAGQLLASLESGKAVKAAAIKGIIAQLDSLSTPQLQRRQLRERFTVHLAMRMPGLPEQWHAHKDAIMKFVDASLAKAIRDAGQVPGRVHVSLELEKICSVLKSVSEECGDDARVVDMIASLMDRRVSMVDTPEKAVEQVRNLRPVLEELGRLDAANPSSGIIGRGIGIMKAMSNIVKPGVMTALHNAAARLDASMVSGIGANGRDIAQDLHTALERLFKAVADNGIEYPRGGELDDSDGILSALKFIYGDFAASLPLAEREALYAKLTSEDGVNLRLFYDETADRKAINSIKIYDTMVDALRETLVPRREKPDLEKAVCDMARIPTRILGEYPLVTMFVGSAGRASDRIIDGYKDKMAGIQWRDDRPEMMALEPNRYMHRRIKEACLKRTQGNFLVAMNRFANGQKSSFEKDITRMMDVVLPNGVKLPSDFEAARDQVAKYISGDGSATFAGLDAVSQRKAWMLMAMLSQETEKLVSEALPEACGAGGETVLPLARFGSNGPRNFVVSESADGGWVVTYKASLGLQGLIVAGVGEVACGEGSTSDSEIAIRIPPAQIEKFANMDTDAYKGNEDMLLELPEMQIDLDVEAALVYKLKAQ